MPAAQLLESKISNRNKLYRISFPFHFLFSPPPPIILSNRELTEEREWREIVRRIKLNFASLSDRIEDGVKKKRKRKKKRGATYQKPGELLIHGIIIIRPIRFNESYSRVASAPARAKTWRVETEEEERGPENRVVKRTTRAASFSERVSSAGLVHRLV